MSDERLAELIGIMRNGWERDGDAEDEIAAALTDYARLRSLEQAVVGAGDALEAGAFACEFKANRGSKQHAATLRSLAALALLGRGE